MPPQQSPTAIQSLHFTSEHSPNLADTLVFREAAQAQEGGADMAPSVGRCCPASPYLVRHMQLSDLALALVQLLAQARYGLLKPLHRLIHLPLSNLLLHACSLAQALQLVCQHGLHGAKAHTNQAESMGGQGAALQKGTYHMALFAGRPNG